MNTTHNRHTPDPGRPGGALLYSVAGALIAATFLTILHHIHVVWS